MEDSFFLKGVAIGFSIAAPVGPIGVLCIRRTITQGRIAGIISGLGAATADAIYGCVAAFGLTYISTLLISHRFWLQLIGGLFLLYLGEKVILAKPEVQPVEQKRNNLAGNYASSFILTLTNPVTILAFAAIFAGFGLATTGGDYRSALSIILGVFIGSSAWWIVLSIIIGVFREKFTSRGLLWVNRISGIILVGFGIMAVILALS
jgi:threonine/homoserine/homoserine lactone efflux protein